jgi:hypothetical protein
VRRRTLWFLLAGCALVLWLETPRTLAALGPTDELPRARQMDSARRATGRAGLESPVELAQAPLRRAG